MLIPITSLLKTADRQKMNENKVEHPGLFSQYGKQFQETIFQGLLSDHAWAQQMTEVMNPDYFEVKSLSYLADKYFAYQRKYKFYNFR